MSASSVVMGTTPIGAPTYDFPVSSASSTHERERGAARLPSTTPAVFVAEQLLDAARDYAVAARDLQDETMKELLQLCGARLRPQRFSPFEVLGFPLPQLSLIGPAFRDRQAAKYFLDPRVEDLLEPEKRLEHPGPGFVQPFLRVVDGAVPPDVYAGEGVPVVSVPAPLLTRRIIDLGLDALPVYHQLIEYLLGQFPVVRLDV